MSREHLCILDLPHIHPQQVQKSAILALSTQERKRRLHARIDFQVHRDRYLGHRLQFQFVNIDTVAGDCFYSYPFFVLRKISHCLSHSLDRYELALLLQHSLYVQEQSNCTASILVSHNQDLVA